MWILAREFVRAGHEVIVLTSSAGDTHYDGIEVRRNPSIFETFNVLRWADGILSANVSLRHSWPLLFANRPTVFSHHTWYQRTNGSKAWRDNAKIRIARGFRNVSVSSAIASSLPFQSTVIANPYREDLFRMDAHARRDRDFVAVGRLVSDKGFDLAIRALANLERWNLRPTLTIVGDGPERFNLQQLIESENLTSRVTLMGALPQSEVAELLRQHRILLIPSRWNEPFGVTALEGMACGCFVIGSSGGGLPEAIGPGGCTFPNNDLESLTSHLREALVNYPSPAWRSEEINSHLTKHSAAHVANRYLTVLHEAIAQWD